MLADGKEQRLAVPGQDRVALVERCVDGRSDVLGGAERAAGEQLRSIDVQLAGAAVAVRIEPEPAIVELRAELLLLAVQRVAEVFRRGPRAAGLTYAPKIEVLLGRV